MIGSSPSSSRKIVHSICSLGQGVGSEFTYQVLYGADWQFANRWSLDFGYRLLGYEIKKDRVNLDMVMHGLFAGIAINF